MPKKPATPEPLRNDSELKIIGGSMRGRKLNYHGDLVTRPMKHRVREAIFNLIGVEAKGRHAFDLFAGTGALGIEALSRGAEWLTLIERHIPTSRVIRQNLAELGVIEQSELLETSALLWGQRDLPALAAALGPRPWLVFISPPYSFFVDRVTEMLALIAALQQHAPASSTLVVETDQRFEFALLAGVWDVREYPPARVGLWRKG
jgi:16S rRNA (guanine(966)-N(2))-methyltransferase RsmD